MSTGRISYGVPPSGGKVPTIAMSSKYFNGLDTAAAAPAEAGTPYVEVFAKGASGRFA